jgi:release factor glutamine methyltransferase
MYIPDVDSFLLIDSLKDYSGESALEIGTGTGIVSNFLLKNFKNVVSTDIDYDSVLYCKKRYNSEITFICCDDHFHDKTIHGGKTGIEKTLHFLHSSISNLAKYGHMILIVSSLSDIPKLDRFIIEKKINKKLINKRRIFYETLYVYELSIINLP